MLKFTLKISYSLIVCCLLSGCYHFGNTSLYVKNYAAQPLIKNTDRIAIVASNPDLESFEGFKTVKLRAQLHLKERGYTVVEKTISKKPNLFALLEPRVRTETHTVTQEVCEEHIIDYSKPATDYNNTYKTCHDVTYTTYTYVYDLNLNIYQPNTNCKIIKECLITNKGIHDIIFSSQIHYATGKIISDNEMFMMMTDAIFATFPLNQNSIVYFQRTPDGYIPTQIIKNSLS